MCVSRYPLSYPVTLASLLKKDFRNLRHELSVINGASYQWKNSALDCMVCIYSRVESLHGKFFRISSFACTLTFLNAIHTLGRVLHSLHKYIREFDCSLHSMNSQQSGTSGDYLSKNFSGIWMFRHICLPLCTLMKWWVCPFWLQRGSLCKQTFTPISDHIFSSDIVL